MDKINKLTLPSTILIASVILGGFFYVSQVNKQKSIEKQQQIKLQEDRLVEEAKTEQDKMDYISKRKTDCLAIYKTESDKYGNVHSWHYSYIEPVKNTSEELDLSAIIRDIRN